MTSRFLPQGGLICVALLLVSCGDEPTPSEKLAPASVVTPATHDNGLVERKLTSPAGEQLHLNRRAVPGEFLVKFKSGASKAVIGEALRKASPASVRTFKLVPELRHVKLARGASV